MRASTEKMFNDLVSVGLAKKVGRHHAYTLKGNARRAALGIVGGDSVTNFIKLHDRMHEGTMNHTKSERDTLLDELVGRLQGPIQEIVRNALERVQVTGDTAPAPAPVAQVTAPVAPAPMTKETWDQVIDAVILLPDAYASIGFNPKDLMTHAQGLFPGHHIHERSFAKDYDRRSAKKPGASIKTAPRFGANDMFICVRETREFQIANLEDSTYRFALNVRKTQT